MSDDRCVILLIMLLCNWELMILCVTSGHTLNWACPQGPQSVISSDDRWLADNKKD